jgi:hypothetical protein
MEIHPLVAEYLSLLLFQEEANHEARYAKFLSACELLGNHHVDSVCSWVMYGLDA